MASRPHLHVEHQALEGLAGDVLRAWGADPDHAGATAANFVAADLLGIDSHGVHMLSVDEIMYE